jgi:hypothetical protein
MWKPTTPALAAVTVRREVWFFIQEIMSVSTSRLQSYLSDRLYSKFGFMRIYENHRPDWLVDSNLARLELDFYLPELRLAAEVQGNQHFTFIPFFHNTFSGYENQKNRDNEKRNLCAGKGIELVEVCTYTDADIFIQEIERLAGIKKERPYCNTSKEYEILNMLENGDTDKRIEKKIAKLLIDYDMVGGKVESCAIKNFYRAHEENINTRINGIVTDRKKHAISQVR